MSQRWADTCVYEHGGLEGPGYTSSFKNVGQNLAYSTDPITGKDGIDATDRWHSEEDFYTLETNYCLPGEMCGHYTQVCH